MRAFRSIWLPGLAVPIALLVQWYMHLPVPTVESSLAQVEREADSGDYRLIDVEALSKLYQLGHEGFLLVDTRQGWEHRAGYIERSVNFPIEPTWWSRWRRRGDLKALLGPDKDRTIVFY